MSMLDPASAIVVPDWPAPANIRAAVTTRLLPGNSLPPYESFNLGVRSGEDPETVQANRALLKRAFALPSAPHWLRQVHGTGVARFPADLVPGKQVRAAGDIGAREATNNAQADAQRHEADARSHAQQPEIEADAAVTFEPGVVLAILSADCLPVLLCSEDGTKVGAAHAGWRGLCAGVVENCVAQFRSPPQGLMAWLGPAIGAASYEVGDEVRDAFVSQSNAASAAFSPSRAGHWFCDLYTLARLRLRTAGVERTYAGGFDTVTDPRFYSYRRDGSRSGRFATLIYRAV